MGFEDRVESARIARREAAEAGRRREAERAELIRRSKQRDDYPTAAELLLPEFDDAVARLRSKKHESIQSIEDRMRTYPHNSHNTGVRLAWCYRQHVLSERPYDAAPKEIKRAWKRRRLCSWTVFPPGLDRDGPAITIPFDGPPTVSVIVPGRLLVTEFAAKNHWPRTSGGSSDMPSDNIPSRSPGFRSDVALESALDSLAKHLAQLD